jgi:hypothetical protein
MVVMAMVGIVLFGVLRISRFHRSLVERLAVAIVMRRVVPVVVRSMVIMPVAAHVNPGLEGVHSYAMFPAGEPVAKPLPSAADSAVGTHDVSGRMNWR